MTSVTIYINNQWETIMVKNILLFDIDGTLLSSAGAGKDALEKGMAAKFGVDHIVDGLSLSGRTDKGILHDLLRLHGIEHTDASYETMMIAESSKFKVLKDSKVTQFYFGSCPQISRKKPHRAIIPGFQILKHSFNPGQYLSLHTFKALRKIR